MMQILVTHSNQAPPALKWGIYFGHLAVCFFLSGGEDDDNDDGRRPESEDDRGEWREAGEGIKPE